jgi:putative hydrolase of the HAD superfamily
MTRLLVAFDADDTLWHNEPYYLQARQRFADLLKDYGQPEVVSAALDGIEIANVQVYGYGIKSFTLSMIETALTFTDHRASGEIIAGIVALGREMLSAQVPLFEDVEMILAELSRSYELLLVTKGDLLEQENKVLRSGLLSFFRHIEIVREKTPLVYQALIERFGVPLQNFVMVGNSLKSDILPVLAIGGKAVYIPYVTTWSHEQVSDLGNTQGCYELQSLRDLPALLEYLTNQTAVSLTP